MRVREIEEALLRWGRFFEKCGPDGLSASEQRGLFAELLWIERLLEHDLDPGSAVASWKGCDRGYHDFDLDGRVVEVKSTMTKEPRHVRISNERQLDDRGLVSLHLYVATLHSSEGGGTTLPELVERLRLRLASASALPRLERSLVTAGYLDGHAARYDAHYVVKAEELFEVTPGFPRIVELPQGTGRLRYTVEISACSQFEIQAPEYLDSLNSGGADA